MCTHRYTHAHVSGNRHMPIYTDIYIHNTHMQTGVSVHRHILMHTCMYTHTHTCIYMHIGTQECTQPHTHAQTYHWHAYMCSAVHVSTHAYASTLTRAFSDDSQWVLIEGPAVMSGWSSVHRGKRSFYKKRAEDTV